MVSSRAERRIHISSPKHQRRRLLRERGEHQYVRLAVGTDIPVSGLMALALNSQDAAGLSCGQIEFENLA
jgi:hypothetical protein